MMNLKIKSAMLTAAFVFSLLAPGNSVLDASQPTFGEVSLTFLEPPTPDAPWHLRISARSYFQFENGKVAIARRRPGPGPSDVQEDIIWTGAANTRDTLVFEHYYAPPLPGLYMLVGSINPFPDGSQPHIPATFSIWYVLVRADTGLISQYDYGDLLRREVDVDIQKRGLTGVNPKQLDSLAPDLAERWRKVKGWRDIGPPPKPMRPPPSSPPRTYQVEDPGEGPYRDTIAMPGSGPPPPKPIPPDYWERVREIVGGDTMHRRPPPPEDWGGTGRDAARRPRRTRPAPSVSPEDTEFGRSEEAARLRELFKLYKDSLRAADSAGARRSTMMG